MKKLSEKKYWDSLYETKKTEKESKEPVRSGVKAYIKHITRDYSNYYMWEVLYEKYLPKKTDWTVIEVGCAPGKHVLNLSKRFGYVPYGVEYSEVGCVVTRNNFRKAGFPADHVIQADFFDEKLQLENEGAYNVVVSLGFIEHFDNISQVVEDHIRLVKTGGYLVVLIPNLRGINYYLSKFLNEDSLAIHNLSIMNKKTFSSVFPEEKVEALYCAYTGFFSFGIFNTNRQWKYILYRIALLVQRPFDFLWRMLFGSRHLRSPFTSPYLIFVGRKR